MQQNSQDLTATSVLTASGQPETGLVWLICRRGVEAIHPPFMPHPCVLYLCCGGEARVMNALLMHQASTVDTGLLTKNCARAAVAGRDPPYGPAYPTWRLREQARRRAEYLLQSFHHHSRLAVLALTRNMPAHLPTF